MDWADWLALAEFTYNNREHSATKMSPFFANTGANPTDFSNLLLASSNVSAEEFAKQMKDLHDITKHNLQKVADDMKCFHDRHAGDPPVFNKGDKVFLDGRNLKTSRLTSKMEDKWFGPFEVLEKVGVLAYRLKIPRTWKHVHPVFNVILLKPAVPLAFPSQAHCPPPAPIIVDDEAEYELEEIRDAHIHHRKLQFLVKWVRYSKPEWQPASNFGDHAQEAIQEFYEAHPDAARQILPRPPSSVDPGRSTLRGG